MKNTKPALCAVIALLLALRVSYAQPMDMFQRYYGTLAAEHTLNAQAMDFGYVFCGSANDTLTLSDSNFFAVTDKNGAPLVNQYVSIVKNGVHLPCYLSAVTSINATEFAFCGSLIDPYLPFYSASVHPFIMIVNKATQAISSINYIPLQQGNILGLDVKDIIYSQSQNAIYATGSLTQARSYVPSPPDTKVFLFSYNLFNGISNMKVYPIGTYMASDEVSTGYSLIEHSGYIYAAGEVYNLQPVLGVNYHHTYGFILKTDPMLSISDYEIYTHQTSGASGPREGTYFRSICELGSNRILIGGSVDYYLSCNSVMFVEVDNSLNFTRRVILDCQAKDNYAEDLSAGTDYVYAGVTGYNRVASGSWPGRADMDVCVIDKSTLYPYVYAGALANQYAGGIMNRAVDIDFYANPVSTADDTLVYFGTGNNVGNGDHDNAIYKFNMDRLKNNMVCPFVTQEVDTGNRNVVREPLWANGNEVRTGSKEACIWMLTPMNDQLLCHDFIDMGLVSVADAQADLVAVFSDKDGIRLKLHDARAGLATQLLYMDVYDMQGKVIGKNIMIRNEESLFSCGLTEGSLVLVQVRDSKGILMYSRKVLLN